MKNKSERIEEIGTRKVRSNYQDLMDDGEVMLDGYYDAQQLRDIADAMDEGEP